MDMIYFFTYGDEKFTNTKKRIEKEAIESKFFNDIKIYGRDDIALDFIDKTTPYINIKGGFWLWKSLFLKQTFEKMKEGDYCIYADAGCTINPYGFDRFSEYLKMVDSHKSGFLAFELSGLRERSWTNSKVFEHFEIDDEEFKNGTHLMATIFITKKCSNSQKIVDDYYDLAVNSTSLFSDDFNNYKKDEYYSAHRNDQSVFSVLRKINNVYTINDETWAENLEGWNKLFYEKKIPFLATRIRG